MHAEISMTQAIEPQDEAGFLSGTDFTPWSPTTAEYHGDHRYLNRSALEVFRRSVALFHSRFIARNLPPSPPTEAMALGTAAHILLLEPQDSARVVAMPNFNLRTNAGKDARDAFQVEHEGSILLTAEQYETAWMMAAAVGSNEIARRLLKAQGKTEHALRWSDSRTGIPCKARLDKVIENSVHQGLGSSSNAVIIELKTAVDPFPQGWQKAAMNFGYHRQAAFYQRAWQILHGEVPQVLFIVIGKAAPHEVIVYELGEAFIRMAREENACLLDQLAERLDTHDWTGRFANGVVPLSPPRWATRESSSTY